MAAKLAHDAGARVAIPCHFWMFAEHGGSPAQFLEACQEFGAQSPTAPDDTRRIAGLSQMKGGNAMMTRAELTLQEREAIIQRFNTRVDQAIAASPPSKSWVRAALRQRGAPRCPVRLKRLSLEVILRYGDALADLFCQYPDDAVFVPAYDFSVGFQPHDSPNRINPIQVLTEEARWLDECGSEWSHAAGR